MGESVSENASNKSTYRFVVRASRKYKKAKYAASMCLQIRADAGSKPRNHTMIKGHNKDR